MITGFDTITIGVSDPSAAIADYETLFGQDAIRDADHRGAAEFTIKSHTANVPTLVIGALSPRD